METFPIEKNKSYRLTLPEGLKELMSDISREVLRAKPSDLYSFIANYLSVLLVTRDNLSIACRVCNYVCECQCHPELLCELEEIGLDEENARIVQEVIMKHFQKEKVDESSLLSALLAKTNIDEHMYPAIVNAVRLAYIRHQAHYTAKYEASPESDEDEIAKAVSHTLELYRKSEPTDGLYGDMATKIQAAYRAYGVRRGILKNIQVTPKIISMSEPNFEDAGPTSNNSSISERMKQEIELTTSMHQKRESTESSISLAGSLYALPRYKKCNVYDSENLSQLKETEKENAHIDYTTSPYPSLISEEGKQPSDNRNKRISFLNSSEEVLCERQRAHEFSDLTSTNENTSPAELETESKNQLWKAEYEYNDECSENSDESVFEEVIELDDIDDESVSDIDSANDEKKEVDTDIGDELEAQ